MRSLVVGFLLYFCQIAFADTFVVSGTTSAENTGSRYVVALGDELVSDLEGLDYDSGDVINSPLTYTIPSGFRLTSATLDFALNGALNTVVSNGFTPIGDAAVPATFMPTTTNSLVLLAYIGDDWLLLVNDEVTHGDLNVTTSFDLLDLGYGDSLMAGVPISLWGSLRLFSYSADQVGSWWGHNAITWVNIDQDWSGDYSATLRLGLEPVPEPGTIALVGIGLAGMLNRRLRRSS